MPGPDAPKGEPGAMMLLASCTHRPRRHHDDVIENLFRQIPVFRRGSAADIGRIVKRRNQHPGIFEHLLAGQGLKTDRRVGARPHAAQPALSSPPGQQLRCAGAADVQSPLRIGDPHDIAGFSDNSGQSAAPFGYGSEIAHIAVYPIHRNSHLSLWRKLIDLTR